MGERKVEITKDGYQVLITKVLKNKEEERELALDRYRRADVEMNGNEQFVLMGKNAVAFLTLAANSTNEIAKLAESIKGIIYKDETTPDINLNMNDNWKKEIANIIKNQKNETDIVENNKKTEE